VAADFEFRHIPSEKISLGKNRGEGGGEGNLRGVVMGRSLDNPELRLVACFCIPHVDRKLDFEEFHRFVPLDLSGALDVGLLPFERG